MHTGHLVVRSAHCTMLQCNQFEPWMSATQAREFSEYVNVTGIVLTKLDGTARGGAVVSVVDELGLPIKFVGVGETVEDLQPFDPEAFVQSLFPEGDAAKPGGRAAMADVAM